MSRFMTHRRLTIANISVTNSWAIYISIIGQELIYGGPQTAILGLLVAAFVQWTITLGLSELASAFPSSGVSRCEAHMSSEGELTLLHRDNTIMCTFSLPEKLRRYPHTLWVGYL